MKKNMKCAFALVGAMLLGAQASLALDPVDLSVGIFKPIPTTPGHGKEPIEVPSVSQDNYEIIFESSHADYTLNLLVSDVVVYSVDVPSSVTSVILPSWLSGEYEIRLVPDDSNYFYY